MSINQPTAKHPGEMRVLTLNLWGRNGAWAERRSMLIEGLRALPEIADVRIVEAPSEAVRGTFTALRRFPADARRWQALGREMNTGPAGQPSDVAHVQHQYFFFGGVAPHKNHARAFLDAVRVPLVLTAHEIARPAPNASALERHAIALTNRSNFLHPAIRHLIVHTDPDRQELIALGAAPERVHVLIHPVPPAQPMPPTEAAKRALGLEGKRVVTLFGFLSAKKGHSLALTALRALPSDVVQATSERYLEAYRRITGKPLATA